MFSDRLLGPGFTQNGSAQYSTGRLLPCLTMISCGETGAGVSVACTGPASFDLANVAIDQTAVVATMSAMAAKMIILRISCHPFQRGKLMLLWHTVGSSEGEGPHTSRFFVFAGTAAGVMGAVDARAMRLVRVVTAASGRVVRSTAAQGFASRQSEVASPAVMRLRDSSAT